MTCPALSRMRLVALLALTSASAWGQDISYDAATSILTIPSVQVGTAAYTNVTLRNIGNYTFTLENAAVQVPAGPALAAYDTATGILTLPAVSVGAANYAVTMLNQGNYTFTLQTAAPIEAYVFYSAHSSGPQTATLSSDGTLAMDGLRLTGFSFGASAFDASGTLTRWASPWNNINQPKVEAMLFCGPDNKLAYVLLRSHADDPARSSSNVVDLLAGIQTAGQYEGMGIYRNCFGSASVGWNNDLPYSDYYLWPDVFSSYSYAYVASQLNNAAIFHEAGQPSNQHNFLAITWKGASPFEVWQ